MMSYNTVFTQKAQLEVCIISSSGGHYCPHHPTGRQAPLKERAPLVRFIGVVKRNVIRN